MTQANEPTTIALTGATGTLGRAVLRHMLDRGCAVRALVRPGSEARCLDHPGVTWVPGDLERPASLEALVRGTDAVVHAAYTPMSESPPPGRSAAEHFVQSNIVGTLRLLERTPATRLRRFVFVSSLAVYGPEPHRLPGADRIPLDESFPVWPREFYGAHKAALERMIVAAAGDPGMDTGVYRIGTVLGDYDDRARDPLAPLVDEALRFGELRTRKAGYMITAGDAAAILTDAATGPGSTARVLNTFHCWLDFSEIAEVLSEILGRPIRAAAPPAAPPDPPLLKAALAGREPEWRTRRFIRDRLKQLIGP